MALKKTSDTIAISTLVEQGTVNAFEVNQIDLQLNPLDNEVFIVQAVNLDLQPCDAVAGAEVDLGRASPSVFVCKAFRAVHFLSAHCWCVF